jgi:hypothetical protein
VEKGKTEKAAGYMEQKKMPVAPQQKPKSASDVVNPNPDLNGSKLILVG